jgi:hypothetical protein
MTDPSAAGAQATGVDDQTSYAKLRNEFNSVVESKIGQQATVLVALAVPLATGLCAWLQRKIGIDLSPAALTGFIATMGAGIFATAFKWLANRGDWERTIVQAYGIYLTGKSDLPADPASHAGSGATGAAGQTPPN